MNPIQPKMIKDTIFKQNAPAHDFVFDESVVRVFDDMLERSVPFYTEVQRMITELVVNFAQPHTNVYDLGCSQGNTCFNLARAIKDNSVKVVGVDNSEEMIKESKHRQRILKLSKNLTFEVGDITSRSDLKKPSVVVLALVLQFIRPLDRVKVLKNIYNSLVSGGVLVLFEKNIISDPELNRDFIDLYYDFKKRNRYSKMEIYKKRIALENILIPYTVNENKKMLKRAGFSTVEVFFQWYNFSAILAIKK